MASKKNKPLSSEGITNWADASFCSKARELFYVDNFIFGSPVPGASLVGRCLLALKTVDDGMAAQVLDDLFGDLDSDHFYSNFDSRQVAKKLSFLKLDGSEIPKGTAEFLVFCKSPRGILKDHYGLFQDKEKDKITVEDASPYVNLLILDAVYRHLRNGFAHGAFAEARRKTNSGKQEPFLYLQDANGLGNITARFYLSASRLDKLAKQLT